VVIVNVALALPAGTVTVDGTPAADGPLLLSDIATPPLGAGPLSVTVPPELVPPATLVGLTVNEFKAGGVTVSVAVNMPP
jgi:hypothetical protein